MTSPATGRATPAHDGRRRSMPPTADDPQRALPAAMYVRESTEEQGQGFSPDAQRQAIKTSIPAGARPRAAKISSG